MQAARIAGGIILLGLIAASLWWFARGSGSADSVALPERPATALPSPAEIELSAGDPERSRRSADEAEEPTVASPDESRELLPAEMQGPARIWGRIELNGAPLEGIIHAQTEDGHVRTARVREEGRYDLQEMPAGEVTLTVAPIGRGKYSYTPLFAAGGPFADQAVRLYVAAGETIEQNIALELPLAPIRGRVRYDGGRPAPGIRVMAGSRDLTGDDVTHPNQAFLVFATTDDDGRFALPVPDLPALFDVGVVYAHTDHVQAGLPAGATGIEFVLPEPATVRVRAVDAETFEVLRGWRLEWSLAGTDLVEEVGDDDLDAEGWRTAEVPAGIHDFTVHPSGDTHRAASVTGIELSPALGVRELTVELPRIASGNGG